MELRVVRKTLLERSPHLHRGESESSARENQRFECTRLVDARRLSCGAQANKVMRRKARRLAAETAVHRELKTREARFRDMRGDQV